MMAQPKPVAGAHRALVERLHRRVAPAAAVFGGVSLERFAQALERSAMHRFPDGAPDSQLAAYLESLHLEDLALAAACSDGADAAWDHFVRTFRPELYAAARAICRSDEAAARDLADSLYAELFGVRGSSSERRSLFNYFHGRSKLSTWLRTVLAQRHVDTIRSRRRTDSLDEMTEDSPLEGARALQQTPDPAALDPDRQRFLELLQATLTAALAALPARDRLRMNLYYMQDLTLAQIGRTLREHESSASRHLERTRRELRARVQQVLREEKRLSEAQVAQCFAYAVEEWPFDLAQALAAGGPEERTG